MRESFLSFHIYAFLSVKRKYIVCQKMIERENNRGNELVNYGSLIRQIHK